ncbi:MAG TPA: TonB-dependent receptor, partial [Opitutaceae bacterium]
MHRIFILFVVSAIIASAEEGVLSSEPTTTLAPFIISDRSTDLVGLATTGSQGAVGASQLEERPLLRRGEMLEAIPGVVITQHSGDGKANQYFLRGFNLDHGTDFSISVDGMPVNLRTHAHGQGYADINFIIPEMVQDIAYEKGPYFAEVGDFSAAGAVQFHLYDDSPNNLLSVTFGDDQYVRVLALDTMHEANAETTLAFELGYNNGPWELPEDARHFSGIVRQHWGDLDQSFDLTGMLYHANWRSTDQVPERAVRSGEIDRYGNIDPADGGDTDRESLSFNYTVDHGDSKLQADAYAIYYRLNLYSDFTYFLDDPIHGDQFNQRDRRTVLGGSADYSWSSDLAGKKSKSKVGLGLRQDIIPEVALFHTEDRMYLSTVSDSHVKEGSAGLFAENETRWSDWLRSSGGVRFDLYHFEVANDIAANSGSKIAGIVSPKAGLVFGPWDKTEYYINTGFGFHSNDARGVMLHSDPQSGEGVDSASPLVRSKGVELGARTSAIDGLVSSVSLWALDLNSELVFSGDSGGTEASGSTRRYGVELANFYRINSW